MERMRTRPRRTAAEFERGSDGSDGGQNAYEQRVGVGPAATPFSLRRFDEEKFRLQTGRVQPAYRSVQTRYPSLVNGGEGHVSVNPP